VHARGVPTDLAITELRSERDGPQQVLTGVVILHMMINMCGDRKHTFSVLEAAELTWPVWTTRANTDLNNDGEPSSGAGWRCCCRVGAERSRV
jgi:hypothetical protein